MKLDEVSKLTKFEQVLFGTKKKIYLLLLLQVLGILWGYKLLQKTTK